MVRQVYSCRSIYMTPQSLSDSSRNPECEWNLAKSEAPVEFRFRIAYVAILATRQTRCQLGGGDGQITLENAAVDFFAGYCWKGAYGTLTMPTIGAAR